jgi:intein/homing endonuclease
MKKIIKIEEVEHDDYVQYCDTDSVTGDCLISINGIESKIEDIWNTINTTKEIVDISGRYYKFPTSTTLPYYDETNSVVKMGGVKYIERHKTRKKVFLLKTSLGNSIKVTEDHSIMIVDKNGKLIKKKPKELNKGDKLISI